jgi:hypothetical protein
MLWAWCGPRLSNTQCVSIAFGGFVRLGRSIKIIIIEPHKLKSSKFIPSF